MTYDYAKKVETARRMITKYGRDITLAHASTTPVDATDPSKGVDSSAAVSSTTKGVFVYPSGYLSLGISKDRTALLERTSAIVLVAPVADFDVEKSHKVTDGGGDYLVETVDKLQPGDTPVLFYVGLAK